MINGLRKACCIEENQQLKEIYNFKKFPINMSCVETDQQDDVFHDMKWSVSEKGHIQLSELIDIDLIYKNYHTSGVVGKTWQEHHANFANFIMQDSYDKVLEIGSSSGALVDKFLLTDTNFSYTIVEPSIKRSFDDRRVNNLAEYFENTNFDKTYDTVVHSHCFEHCYEPLNFLRKIHKTLTHKGLHYISIPNMQHWLENGFTNTLSFEHTFYVDYKVLCHMLRKTGFEILDSKIGEHSVFVKARKTDDCFDDQSMDFSYISDLFLHYIKKLELDVANICEKMQNKNAYIFGAHIFAQMLLNLGVPENQIVGILDNDKQKIGKRLYGTKLMVLNPVSLAGLEKPNVIVRAGVYNDEIKSTLSNINPSIQFL